MKRQHSLPLLLILLMSLSAFLHAASETPLIPRTVLFGNPERTQGRLSPDGAAMSFMAPLDGVMNVWIAPAGDLEKARPLTRETGRGVQSHGWTYNSTHLLYIKDSGGDENFHIYSIDTRTGHEIDLTPLDGVRATFIGGSQNYPDSFLVGLNDRDPRWHDVWKVNVITGERTMVAENPGYAGYVVDRDLNIRMALQSRPDGGMNVLRLQEDGEWVLFKEIPQGDALTTSPLGFLKDGSSFYMLDSRDRNTAALFQVDALSGEQTLLAEHPMADISGILADPVTGEVQAYSVEYERSEWIALNEAAVGEALRRLQESFPAGFSVTSQTLDDKQWMIAVDDATAPLSYYTYDRGAGTITPAFSTRPDLSAYTLAPMFSTAIPSRDGMALVSYWSVPVESDPDQNGIPEAPLPLILDVHGGPWARDGYGFNTYHQWFANRGYAVLAVNYRGSTGFGKNFVNAGDLEWGAAMHDDLLDAVQWAVDQGIADPDKVLIHGGSYGGYATLWGVTNSADRFVGGVSIVGPSNLETLIASIPPYWASFFEQFAKRVGDPRTDEGRALLKERSPLTHVDQIADPLLIAQGANDPRVKQAESDQIVEAMRERNIPVLYVLFPDEGHGFARPENRLAFNAVSEAFLARILGGRAEPIGDAFAGSSIQVPEGASLLPGLSEALETHSPRIAH
jgi:dipeptidyl aminopeptidase/acylaminoacyl peptidase